MMKNIKNLDVQRTVTSGSTYDDEQPTFEAPTSSVPAPETSWFAKCSETRITCDVLKSFLSTNFQFTLWFILLPSGLAAPLGEFTLVHALPKDTRTVRSNQPLRCVKTATNDIIHTVLKTTSA
ncbi:hypothetical protein CRM22_007647 [Opisthorchis felineus]|uniref:Uncharacterized protein n=1 Tax=Opisthorchis felineus TaxID=147828 RepID=A0A4S2LNB4_OPIFE|nr:hypothetical protein CRM22_007647 [Opisthorchis felineus]